MFRLLQLIILLFICAFLWSCVAVQPWERDYLADPIMSFEDSPDQAFYREITEIREASAASTESSGGGCGCN